MTNKTAPVPDQHALRRVGASVRKRLDSDPAAYKIPTDLAEIYAVGDFLSSEECTRLIHMINAVARPSELHETAYVAKFRTSYSGNLNPHDPFVKSISRRIDDLLGMPGSVGENIQGQRYLPGQEFKPHNDWFYTDQECWTAMAFLNEVEEGGHTHFVEVGASIEPKPGVLMVWNNATPEGLPNEDTLHAGTPVIKGQKYVLTKWYRTRKHS